MGVPKGKCQPLNFWKGNGKMTVFECMQMLGRHKKVTILTARGKKQIAERISAYEYEQYADEFPRDVFEAILEKTAKSVDLEEMTIYCKE